MAMKDWQQVSKLRWNSEIFTASDISVLWSYALHASAQTGESYPKHATVAAELLLTERTVRDSVRKLRDIGILKPQRKTKNGVMVYTINLDTDVLNEPNPKAQQHRIDRENRAAEERERRQHSTT